MKVKYILFTSILLVSLTYNIKTYSLVEKQNKVKSCKEIISLLNIRKNYLLTNIDEKKQLMSDIESSLKKQLSNRTLSKNDLSNISNFYDASDELIIERTGLVEKIDNLLKLDCPSDPLNFKNKLTIFNRSYQNHLKKEIRINDNFEENIYLKFGKSEK